MPILAWIVKKLIRLERKVKTMVSQEQHDALKAEVAAIKTGFDTFKTTTSTTIADLSAKIASGGVSLDDVQTDLDALKADVDGATLTSSTA